MAGGRPKHPDILTPAEWRVFDGIRRGLTNGEVADELGISLNTVKYHVSNILGKLGVASREELAAMGTPRRWWGWLLSTKVAIGVAGSAVLLAGGLAIA